MLGTADPGPGRARESERRQPAPKVYAVCMVKYPTMLNPDEAWIKPDAAVVKPDLATIKPDYAVIKPDCAVVKADLAHVKHDLEWVRVGPA